MMNAASRVCNLSKSGILRMELYFALRRKLSRPGRANLLCTSMAVQYKVVDRAREADQIPAKTASPLRPTSPSTLFCLWSSAQKRNSARLIDLGLGFHLSGSDFGPEKTSTPSSLLLICNVIQYVPLQLIPTVRLWFPQTIGVESCIRVGTCSIFSSSLDCLGPT